MPPTQTSRQMEWLDDLAEEVFRSDRVWLDEPARLRELAELFPGGGPAEEATHAIDLDTLNGLARPRGFLAAWEPGGLMFFRVHL